MTRRARLTSWILGGTAALLALLAVAGILTVRSGWFHDKVRRSIVAELERATGGSVSIGRFAFDWTMLRVELHDLVIRGSEPASAAPLLAVQTIQAGLKIISLWEKRIDLASLVVEEPRVHLIVAPDGSTNLPAPKIEGSRRPAMETILDLKIGRFAIERATLLANLEKSELNVRGENLRALFNYDAVHRRYEGHVSMDPLEIDEQKLGRLAMQVSADLGLEKNRLQLSNAKVTANGSHLEASGTLDDFQTLRSSVQFGGDFDVDQAIRLLKIPAVRGGRVLAAGTATYVGNGEYTVKASVNARGLAVHVDKLRFTGVEASGALRWNPRVAELTGLTVFALGGRFQGRAEVRHFERFAVEGQVDSFALNRVLDALGEQPRPWSGTASGAVRAEGRLAGGDQVASAQIAIEPATGGIPVEGRIDATYDQPHATLSFAQSHLAAGGTRVNFSGVLGSELQVGLRSTNLDDFLPAVNLVSPEPVQSLPVSLDRGNASFEGTVSGKLESPHVAGQIELASFVFEGTHIDRLAADVAADASAVSVRDGSATVGKATAKFDGRAALHDWKPEAESKVTASATLQGVELSDLLALAGQKDLPLRGRLDVAVQASGTIGDPRATADITVKNGSAYDEPFDEVRAKADYAADRLEVREGLVTAPGAEVRASGTFQHPPKDLTRGEARLHVAATNVAMEKLVIVKRAQPELTGVISADFDGAAKISGQGGRPEILLSSLSGNVAARNLKWKSKPVGTIGLDARSDGAGLSVNVHSDFLECTIAGSGKWRLEPGYPGEAEVRFSRLSFASLRDWLSTSDEPSRIDIDGFAEGRVAISGPALEPKSWRATATISSVRVFPRGGESAAERLLLQNDGPVTFTFDRSVLRTASAKFKGPSVNVEAAGSVSLLQKPVMDLRVNGSLDLRIAERVDPDIHAAGTLAFNATARGPLSQPQLSGLAKIQRGALAIADVPNVLGNANGTIRFSGSRAMIEELKAETGGGNLAVTGFLGLGEELSYHLQVNAKQVRVRYPEGASTTANAELTLTGGSRRSLLSGVVTILRTGFNPRTDLSSLLAKSAEPIRTPSARTGPLSTMRLDIRVETAEDVSFESALAQGIQAEANLRLQGTPYNPTLFGRILISQGEITFFGTKYTISQGSISFSNPVKIEPVLDVDLETKVRGIDVILTLSGPLSKLNMTHRSDPPLEFSEIVTLLATGATPSSDPTLAALQPAQSQSFTQLGANALLGQVVASPVSSRLQRFFGVSRLKIDPQLTGVENNPQARLTLEQQVTKNITFTYITNLTSSNPQVVRVEWSLNKNWSVVADRGENGIFGIDFLYKRRFK